MISQFFHLLIEDEGAFSCPSQIQSWNVTSWRILWACRIPRDILEVKPCISLQAPVGAAVVQFVGNQREQQIALLGLKLLNLELCAEEGREQLQNIDTGSLIYGFRVWYDAVTMLKLNKSVSELELVNDWIEDFLGTYCLKFHNGRKWDTKINKYMPFKNGGGMLCALFLRVNPSL